MAERTNQMERTRAAIVAAARGLADTGAEITMPAVAAEARVSEATAYRYFPDLVSILRAAVMVEDHVATLRSVTRGDDPVERIGQAAEILARAVLRRQGAVRAVIAATIARPAAADERPGHRFGLIEHALAPWLEREGHPDVRDLVQDLAVIISAESVFTLIDRCGATADDAVAGLVGAARRATAAAVRGSEPADAEPHSA